MMKAGKARKQGGVTLLGFLMLLAMGLFITYIGFKLVPHYIAYYSVINAMEGVATQSRTAPMSGAQMRQSMASRLNINYVDAVGPEDIRFVRGRGVSMVVSYQVREPLFGNVDACLNFEHSVDVN